MIEKNPTPVNFMYLNSDWENKQKQHQKQLESIVDLLELFVAYF